MLCYTMLYCAICSTLFVIGGITWDATAITARARTDAILIDILAGPRSKEARVCVSYAAVVLEGLRSNNKAYECGDQTLA